MSEMNSNSTTNPAPKAVPARAGRHVFPDTLELLICELQTAGIAAAGAGPDDGQGRAWIQFRAASSLRDFLNAAVRYSESPDSIYARLPWPGDAEPSEPRWVMKTWVEDLARYKDSGDPDWPVQVDRPPEMRLSHMLRIPHDDLREVMANLREHNRKAGR